MLTAITMQAALKKAGLYSGELDGLFGPRSRAAADAALTAAGVKLEAWPHSRRMIAIRQWVLKEAGFDPGPIDGVEGPKTRAAAYAFSKPVGVELPWITEAEKVIGHHEVVDSEELRAWLRKDGATLGDPAKLPWCGDFVETAIKLALPKEKVPANPYLARNWADWGEDATRRYGAVIVFWRGTKKGTQGHVGFATAIDEARGLVEVLGGNQGNEVSRAWLGMDRILAWRAPKGWASKMPIIGARSSGGAAISTNEA
jgi:uncharacterized protein (TIGR02594 family)